MRLHLNCHPESHCEAPISIEAEATRLEAGRLALLYVVSGAVAELRLPPPATPARTDELWQHTCFEAFVRGPSDEAYYEINLAPSRQWAAYRFGGYRSEMQPAELPPPLLETFGEPGRYELRAMLSLNRWSLPADATWHLALSAVIEERNGRKSYWALTHPSGKADFHHQDCFTHQLSGPGNR